MIAPAASNLPLLCVDCRRLGDHSYLPKGIFFHHKRSENQEKKTKIKAKICRNTGVFQEEWTIAFLAVLRCDLGENTLLHLFGLNRLLIVFVGFIYFNVAV